MSALDVLLLQSSKGDFPQLLVGESGGVRVWEEAEGGFACKMEIKRHEKIKYVKLFFILIDPGESDSVSKFKDTFISVQSFDAGTSLVTCQGLSGYVRAVFINSVWYFGHISNMVVQCR